MLKITLDTNCIINFFDTTFTTAISVKELSEIINYATKGVIDIAITTRIGLDLSKDKNKVRQVSLFKQLNMFPKIPCIARFGITTYGDHEKFWSKEDIELEKELLVNIFPTLTKDDKRYTNKIADIDHLIAHIISKRDIFVTDDIKLLKTANLLDQKYHLIVDSPKQCLQKIKLNHR